MNPTPSQAGGLKLDVEFLGEVFEEGSMQTRIIIFIACACLVYSAPPSSEGAGRSYTGTIAALKLSPNFLGQGWMLEQTMFIVEDTSTPTPKQEDRVRGIRLAGVKKHGAFTFADQFAPIERLPFLTITVDVFESEDLARRHFGNVFLGHVGQRNSVEREQNPRLTMPPEVNVVYGWGDAAFETTKKNALKSTTRTIDVLTNNVILHCDEFFAKDQQMLVIHRFMVAIGAETKTPKQFIAEQELKTATTNDITEAPGVYRGKLAALLQSPEFLGNEWSSERDKYGLIDDTSATPANAGTNVSAIFRAWKDAGIKRHGKVTYKGPDGQNIELVVEVFPSRDAADAWWNQMFVDAGDDPGKATSPAAKKAREQRLANQKPVAGLGDRALDIGESMRVVQAGNCVFRCGHSSAEAERDRVLTRYLDVVGASAKSAERR